MSIGIISIILILACGAIWMTQYNRHSRKATRIRRLQTNISSWTVDVRKALFVPRFEKQTLLESGMGEKLKALAALRSIIESSATELKPDGELASKVGNAATHLEQFIKGVSSLVKPFFISLKGISME